MASSNPSRPNIVFILSDDHGAWALNCAGNSEIITPNLDHLAAEGLRFSNFFCATPVCSPARATILTGRIPSQHGIHDWIRSGSFIPTPELNNIRKDDRVIEYLDGQLTYTDLLARHGYNCGLSGKWHLGSSIKPQKGFQSWTVIPWGGCNYYNPVIIRYGKAANETGYVTDIITRGALDFLNQHARDNEPFYLSVHYTAPHSPWDKGQHPEEIVNLYASCPFLSCPNVPLHPWMRKDSPLTALNRRQEFLAGYYAAVTAMDRGIGEINKHLTDLGLSDNTVIIFCGDNGMNMGHHGIWGKGNGTFPLNMYDTSVKVPMIMSWHGHIPAGSVSDVLCSQYDFYPTLLEITGIENPDIVEKPGKSFLPVIHHPANNHQNRIVVFDEYGPVRMIRTAKWKLIHRFPYGPHELYDLLNDPLEETNRIADPGCMSIVQSLRKELNDWFHQYTNPELDGARLPVFGRGQRNLAGLKNQGDLSFWDDIGESNA